MSIIEVDVELAKKYASELIRKLKPMPDGTVSLPEDEEGKWIILRSNIIFDLGAFVCESLPPEVAYDIGELSGEESGRRIVETLKRSFGKIYKEDLVRTLITNYYCNGLFWGRVELKSDSVILEMRGYLVEEEVARYRPRDEYDEKKWYGKQYMLAGYLGGVLSQALGKKLRATKIEVIEDGMRVIYSIPSNSEVSRDGRESGEDRGRAKV